MDQHDKLMSQQEVWEYLGITRSGFHKLQKTDLTFPKPIKVLSLKKWKKIEIDEYLEKTRQQP